MDQMERIHPQHSFQLLRMCITPALLFFFQVTPANLTEECAKEYDKLKDELTLRILQPKYGATAPDCAEQRKRLAMTKLSLPLQMQGAGHTSAVTLAPLAFWASVASATNNDEDIKNHKDGLKRFAEPAHALVNLRLGPPCAENAKAMACFPRDDAKLLLSDTYYYDIQSKCQLKAVEGVNEGSPRRGKGLHATRSSQQKSRLPLRLHSDERSVAVEQSPIRTPIQSIAPNGRGGVHSLGAALQPSTTSGAARKPAPIA
jgi:hypothetical protein